MKAQLYILFANEKFGLSQGELLVATITVNLRVLQYLESFMKTLIVTVFNLIFGYYMMKYSSNLGKFKISIFSNY